MPLRAQLDDRDLLPAMQFVGLDGHRHVVRVKPHRYVELEIGGYLDVLGGRRYEDDHAGRHIH